MDEFYKQKKYSKKRGEWIYHNPECKQCTSQKAKQWGLKNKERKYQNNQNYIRTPKGIEASRKRHKNYVETGKQKEWIDNNRDRLILYTRNHRKHEINNKEWVECKNYFDNSCAYCGFTAQDHKNTYKQDLHKEHVYHNGANDLSNCVPACKSCNSQKSDYEFEEWFNEKNEKFSIEKFNKILLWLELHHKDYLKVK